MNTYTAMPKKLTAVDDQGRYLCYLTEDQLHAVYKAEDRMKDCAERNSARFRAPVALRVLESADDYFPYYRKYHAFWSMYGLDLPDDVLRKIYYQNALRIIPGIDRSLFPG